ncbi:helix-turn-helix domain-containing protein [Vibrio sinaloensis]|nr:helix-turn-helix domain-containing protein [Vibrio sinaloensis]
MDGPDRFNSLKSRIEGISQRMLTQTLRDLEREGYVNRTVYPEVPVKSGILPYRDGRGFG